MNGSNQRSVTQTQWNQFTSMFGRGTGVPKFMSPAQKEFIQMNPWAESVLATRERLKDRERTPAAATRKPMERPGTFGGTRQSQVFDRPRESGGISTARGRVYDGTRFAEVNDMTMAGGASGHYGNREANRRLLKNLRAAGLSNSEIRDWAAANKLERDTGGLAASGSLGEWLKKRRDQQAQIITDAAEVDRIGVLYTAPPERGMYKGQTITLGRYNEDGEVERYKMVWKGGRWQEVEEGSTAKRTHSGPLPQPTEDGQVYRMPLPSPPGS